MASTAYEAILARIGHANAAYVAFGRLIDEFWKNNEITGKWIIDEQSGRRHYSIDTVPTMPMEPRLAFSSAVANLRAALDHVAYNLVMNANGGAIPHRTKVYFPIGKSAADYPKWRDKCLPGVGPSILTTVDSIEPYRGGKGHALWQLNELAIIDKHQLTIGASLSCSGVALSIPKSIRCFLKEHGVEDFEPPEIYIRPASVGQPLKPGHIILTEPISGEDDDTRRKFMAEFFIETPDFGNEKSVSQILSEIGQTADQAVRLFEPYLCT